jgi:TIGR03009 family protein
MKSRVGLWAATGVWLVLGLAQVAVGQFAPAGPPAGTSAAGQDQSPSGQTSPYRPAPVPPSAGPQDPAGPPPGVNQGPPNASQEGGPSAQGPMVPLVPQDPTLQRRAGPPPPPFVLTSDEQRQLDGVLQAWEQSAKQVKGFESDFTRIERDAVFNKERQDKGKLKYAYPDKGLFKIEGPRPEQWVCDGKSVFEYRYHEKQIVEHRLPPEAQGIAIANGPLPFLFGMEADKLKERFFLRVNSSDAAKGEVWLEAHPKLRRDAANYRKVELILRNMQPYGVKVYSPNGKNETVYVLEDAQVNPREPRAPLDPLGLFRNDPFRAPTPSGWQKVLDAPPPEQPAQAPVRTGYQQTMGMR